MDAPRLSQELEALGLASRRPQLDALEAFEEALYQANLSMNLTRVPRAECWVRHILDSVLFQDLVPRGSRVLDIGCGPGFPCWPLACLRPDLEVVGLDSSRKMLSFLQSRPLPNLSVVEARAEAWGCREGFDLVTGRALAPLATQLELSAGPCRVGGLVIPMRTPKDLSAGSPAGPTEEGAQSAAELLGLVLREVVRRALPVVEAPRAFPIYEKALPTPARYPRSWAQIRRGPLQ